MGIESSGEVKEKTLLPLGGILTWGPLFVKASWEHGYILLGAFCVLWSSLQPGWVLVCCLLCSCTYTAGGVVEEQCCRWAEWVSSLCSGPWAFGGSHSSWDSSRREEGLEDGGVTWRLLERDDPLEGMQKESNCSCGDKWVLGTNRGEAGI